MAEESFHPAASRHSYFLTIAILPGVKWNRSIVWICISLMAKGAERVFVYLLATCTFSAKCLFISMSIFIGSFIFGGHIF